MSYRLKEVDSEYIDRKNEKDKAGVKFPKIFKRKISMSKINGKIAKQWIEEKLNEQLPDDDIVVDYLWELLVVDDVPDIESIHLQMEDFLGKDESRKFCEEMWKMLISANDDPDGIPADILSKRSNEIKKMTEINQQQQENTVSKPKTNYNRSQYNSSKRQVALEKSYNRDYRYNNSVRGSRGPDRSNKHRNYSLNTGEYDKGKSYREIDERDEKDKKL